jgi:hypothetical protein
MSGPLELIPLLRKGVRTRRISSYDRTGGNADFIRIEAGERKTIAEIPGAGIVKHIWITFACADPMIRRNAVLRVYWDGETEPSIESPIGDFFGNGWGEQYSYISLPLAVGPKDGACLVSYLPMPFGSSARFEIDNDSTEPIAHFYYYLDYEEHAAGIDPEMGRLHAWWNRQKPGPESTQGDRENEWGSIGPEAKNPTDEHNHVFVHAVGRGHYIGVNYYVDCPTPMWYGEGDDMFLIDGEPWPGSHHGTGTEDYFNASWCPKEIYTHPYFGYARINKTESGWLGRTHCYRWHLEDPIVFEKSLRASIEHGHANCLTLDLVTVAYWYQTEPHAKFPTLPDKAGRQPMPPISVVDVHRWRDSWRREMGGGPLWGNEGLPEDKKFKE